MNIKIGLFYLLFFSNLGFLKSQNCQEKIESASKMIDNGQFNESIQAVRNCAGIGNSERWQALRITSIAYILLNNPDSAKVYAKKMLNLNPLYQPNVLKDPKVFILMIHQINIIPKFTVGLAFTIGGNITIPEVTGSYIPAEYTKKYKNGSSYQMGLLAAYNINNKLAIEANIIANSKTYEMSYTLSTLNIGIKESFRSLDIPLMLRYTFRPNKRFRYYVKAGGYSSILLNSFNDFSRTNSANSESLQYARFNSSARRNTLQWGVVAGTGIVYKVKQGHIHFDVSYYHGLTNITKGAVRYDYLNLLYDMYYLDDDIKLRNIAFSIGYNYYINYKTVK